MGSAEVDDLVRCRGQALLKYDEGLDRLAPALVGHADDRGVGDGGMLEKDILDFARVDILTARD